MSISRRTILGSLAGSVAAAGTRAATVPAIKPPPRFLFGAATAAHQIEGDNVNSDYWLLENIRNTGFPERSGDACGSFERWREDLALVRSIGLDCYRFSIEWARIEPEPGHFSRAMLDHYRRICATARDMGIAPVVTFHHFTSPRWLAADGGWENPATVDRYARYCDRAARAIGDLIDWACTINEPNAQVNSWVVAGAKPWAKEGAIRAEAARACGSDRFQAFFQGDSYKVRDICIAAHTKGRDAIKAAAPHAKVGITLALQDIRPGEGGEALYREMYEKARAPFFEAARHDDFIGVQSYNRLSTGPNGYLPTPKPDGPDDWGPGAAPDVLATVVREVHERCGAPIFVTEHGINTVNDALRARHLAASLDGLAGRIADGIAVLGYIHWSLIDNFEWGSGYGPKFGLASFDHDTFVRTPKPSAAAYRALIPRYRERLTPRAVA